MKTNLITVETFANYIEANIVANYLREHDIDCFLADENSVMAVIAPIIVEARLMVLEKDLNRAKILLADYQAK